MDAAPQAVAGSTVWVLVDDIEPEEATQQLQADAANLDELAAQHPIEEVEAGDFVLSKPEDDDKGALSFERVTATTKTRPSKSNGSR